MATKNTQICNGDTNDLWRRTLEKNYNIINGSLVYNVDQAGEDEIVKHKCAPPHICPYCFASCSSHSDFRKHFNQLSRSSKEPRCGGFTRLLKKNEVNDIVNFFCIGSSTTRPDFKGMRKHGTTCPICFVQIKNKRHPHSVGQNQSLFSEFNLLL